MELKGKVAVVTGAASGIGKATAEMLAKAGARVVAGDVQEAQGWAVVEGIRSAGGEATFVKVDLAKPAEARGLIATAAQTYGGIDLLHNNAGVLRTHESFEEQTEEEWRWIVEINLNSLYTTTKAAVPYLRRRGGGVIVNTASMASIAPNQDSVAYGAAKAGVLGLTRSLAPHLAKDNIRIHAICPAGVQTGILQFSTERAHALRAKRGVLAPEDIGRLVLHFARHDELPNGMTVIAHQTPRGPEYLRLKDWEGERVEVG